MNMEAWQKIYDKDFEQNVASHVKEKAYESEVLNRLAGTQKQLKILVIGCGAGKLVEKLAMKGHDVTGIDCSTAAIKYCVKNMKKARYGVMFAEDINKNFQPDEFDVAIITEVLEHLERPFHVLAQLERVAKRIIWTTPIKNRASDPLHLHWFDYVPIYDVKWRPDEPLFCLVEFKREGAK